MRPFPERLLDGVPADEAAKRCLHFEDSPTGCAVLAARDTGPHLR